MKKRVKGIITSIIPIVSITCVDEILAHELNQNTSKVNEDGENNYQALPNKVSLDTVIANRSITTPYERTPTNSDILTSLKNSNAAFLYANEVVVSGEILPAGTLIKTKDDSIHYETSAVEITFVVGSKVDFNDTFEYLPNSDYTDNNY
jgi:hypothetical protein